MNAVLMNKDRRKLTFKIQQKIASFCGKQYAPPFTRWAPVGMPFSNLGRLGEGASQVSMKGNVTRSHVPPIGQLNLGKLVPYSHLW